MSKQAIHELATATQQGKMTFPQVVKGLLEAGVESYLVDFATKQKTHYLSNGTTHTVPLILDPGPIAEDFNGAELVAAIRGAQADTGTVPRVCEAVDHGRRDRLLGVPDRQESDLLRPERRATHRGVSEAAAMSQSGPCLAGQSSDKREDISASALRAVTGWGSSAVECHTYGAQNPPSYPQPFRAGLCLAAGPPGLNELSGERISFFRNKSPSHTRRARGSEAAKVF